MKDIQGLADWITHPRQSVNLCVSRECQQWETFLQGLSMCPRLILNGWDVRVSHHGEASHTVTAEKCSENNVKTIHIQVNQSRVETASNLPWGPGRRPPRGRPRPPGQCQAPRALTPPVSSHSGKLFRMSVRLSQNPKSAPTCKSLHQSFPSIRVYNDKSLMTHFTADPHTHTDILCQRPKGSWSAQQGYQYLNLWILILKVCALPCSN